MILKNEEAITFFYLMFKLQYYILTKTQKKPSIKSFKEYSHLSLEQKIKWRNKLWDNIIWINMFVKENPYRLSEKELEIIDSWNRFIKGSFIVERHLKKYSILMSNDICYGVIGLFEELSDLIPQYRIPAYIDTVLLPFDDKIIYDGIFLSHAISFGGGIKSTLKDSYSKAKAKKQIVTSL